MSSKINISDPKKFLKHYCEISFLLNVSLIIISIIFFLGIKFSIIGQFFGFLFILVVFFSFGLILLSDKYLKPKKLGNRGKQTHFITYLYLIFIIFGIWAFFSRKGEFLLPNINFIILYILIGFSILLTYLNWSLLKDNLHQRKLIPSGTGIKVIKILIGVFCILFYVICFIMAWGILTGGPPLLGMVTGSAISWTSGLFILCVPAVTILFLKLFSKKYHPKVKMSIMIIGLTFTGIFALPFASIPFTIIDANNQFSKHFGSDWNDFDPDVEKNFLDMQFVLGYYYFGLPSSNQDNFKVEKDIVFAETKDYKLKYDVYYPDKKNLIGEDTTIIYIHGGGWSSGDKDQHPEIIHYLAAQGYVIFDIQYRLLDINFFKELSGIDYSYLPPDEDVVGEWTIEDQVNDIANFTRYLYLNNDYDANLENVYFMGGSAGGHLAALACLGYNEGFWSFSKYLNITGGAFFYPANDAEYFFYELEFFYENGFIPGDETPKENPDLYKRYTPSELVDSDDPPCIIFHGTSDQLIPYENGKTIQDEMLKKDLISILVKGYFGSHGHTEGADYLNVALYYLERFLFLTKDD